jgi:HlyD family secretion protein
LLKSVSDSRFKSSPTIDSDRDIPPSQSDGISRRQISWRKIGLLGIFVAIGIGIFIAKNSNLAPTDKSPNNTLTQTVERKTMPVKISANGIVKAYRSINLSPKTAGTIKILLVKEGDRVRQGQVIATMDDASLRGELSQYQGQLIQQQANLQRLRSGNRPQDIAKAEAQLAEVKANLRQLQAGNRPQDIAQAAARLQQSQATLTQKERDWQRYQELSKSGAISGQILEQKRTERDVSQNQVLEYQQALALKKAGTRPEEIAQAKAKVDQQVQAVALLKAGTRPEEIAQSQAQVQAAKGALTTIENRIKETQVVAPFDGIVLEKYADVGAYVSPSMVGGGGASASSSSILLLTSDRQQVVVNISESQISKVKLGQAVTIKADAFAGQEFTGKVEQIAPQAKVAQNVTSVEVRVSIESPTSKKLDTGMNVEAQFAVGQLANTLFVPNAAVVKQSQGSGVYVLGQDGKSVFQPIQIGMTSGKQTEVKSGLQGGERILLSPPAEQPSEGGLKFPPAP